MTEVEYMRVKKKIETMTETRGLRPREQTEGTTPTKTDRRGGGLRPRRQTDGGNYAHEDRKRGLRPRRQTEGTAPTETEDDEDGTTVHDRE
jgi:hypothetical protein